MRKYAWLVLALGILYPIGAVAQPASRHQAPVGAPALAQRIEEVLAAHPELAKTRIGIAVLDLATGRTLYERASRKPFKVASIAKLATTGAALARLGPEYRFITTLLADGWDGKNTVANVYLRGKGDPALTTEVLWKLVAELRLAGVTRVTDAVIVDDSFFDPATLPPAFDQKDEDAAFRAPISAAALNASSVVILISPSRPGEPPRVVVEPPSDYVMLRNEAKTVAEGKGLLTINAAENGARTEIVVAGVLSQGAAATRAVKRVWHPSLYLGATLRATLVAHGLQVERDEVKLGVVPAAARIFAAHRSDSLAVLVRTLNKSSVNFMAEMLLKVIGAEAKGAPGSSANGLTAVRAWLADAGLPEGAYRLANGSGLYDSTRFTPEQLAALLAHAYRDFRYSADFVAALPLAGADGTLGKRMLGGAAERYVRAKTGTLDDVSCLAGYAGSIGRTPLAFAVFVNDLPEKGTSTAKARALEDEVAQALVMYLESEAVVR